MYKSQASLIFLFLLLVHNSVAPPTKNKEGVDTKTDDHDKPVNLDELGLEYKRYLEEVVEALESDPEFRKKLEKAEEADFRNGKVAAELEYVSHHVRTKLDELKRTELERLRELVKQTEELERNEVDPNHVNPGHVDHINPHTFEAADLHKLITQVRKDLSEADRKRRENFKEYELQKKFETEQKLKAMDEEHKKQYINELEEQKKKHNQHQPLHHPGSKVQLEEVWEKEDEMGDQKFNPKTFFLLHDINSDGYWDDDEVKALFLKELDKLYQSGVPEDDMREREEEMERMREHVFKESDTNGDRLISYEEFLEQTRKQEFNKDEGWDTIDSQPQFTQQEYEEFERRRQHEIQQMIDQGLLQPYATGMMPPPPLDHQGQYQPYLPGAHAPPQYAQNMPYPPQGVPPQYAAGHGQYAPAYANQGHLQNGQVNKQQVPIQVQQQHPQVLNQGPQQVHQYQAQPNVVPGHPNAIPSQQNAIPSQPNAIPSQQNAPAYANAIPSQQNAPAYENAVPLHNQPQVPNPSANQAHNIPPQPSHPGVPNNNHPDYPSPKGNQIPQVQHNAKQGSYDQQKPHYQQGAPNQLPHDEKKSN